MYTSYVRQIVYYLCFVSFYMCSTKCEILKKNCTFYRRVYNENLKNCAVNVANNINISTVISEKTLSVEKNLKQSKNIADGMDENYRKHIDIDSQNETLWELPLTPNINIRMSRLDKKTLTFHLTRYPSDVETRKKKTSLQDVIPYLIIPGFIMAGVVPWLIPGLKLAVMAVGMVNQMAFTSSLFTLIRGYIFDTSQEEHLVYINNGYKKYHHIKTPYKHR